MTTTTLRAVTQQTVANCAQAAARALGAYQAGGHRLIRSMQSGVDMAARQGAERLAPRLAAAVRRASGRVGTLAAQGLDALSSGTGRAISASHSGVRSQVNRIADLAARAEGADNRLLSGGVQSAARISLPGAQAVLALSQVVAAGVAKLPGATLASSATAGRVRKTASAVPARRRAKPMVDVVVDAAADIAADVRTSATAAAKPVKALAKRTDKRVRGVAAPVLAAVKADAAAVSAALTAQTTPKARRKAAAKPAKALAAAVAAVSKPAKAARTRRAAKVAVAAVTVPTAA